jgi:hypothetical protein
MLADRDVTSVVSIGDVDGTAVPLLRCLCGKPYPYWTYMLTTDRARARECVACQRRFYVSIAVRVFEISDGE